MGVTLDTGFLIDLLRGHPAARAKVVDLDHRRVVKVLSTPALFEVLTGLRYTVSRTEEAAFRAVAAEFRTEPFDERASERAAEVRAELMHLGRTPGQVDVMIAGIALARGHRLVTRDDSLRRVAPVVGLAIEGY